MRELLRRLESRKVVAVQTKQNTAQLFFVQIVADVVFKLLLLIGYMKMDKTRLNCQVVTHKSGSTASKRQIARLKIKSFFGNQGCRYQKLWTMVQHWPLILMIQSENQIINLSLRDAIYHVIVSNGMLSLGKYRSSLT